MWNDFAVQVYDVGNYFYRQVVERFLEGARFWPRSISREGRYQHTLYMYIYNQDTCMFHSRYPTMTSLPRFNKPGASMIGFRDQSCQHRVIVLLVNNVPIAHLVLDFLTSYFLNMLDQAWDDFTSQLSTSDSIMYGWSATFLHSSTTSAVRCKVWILQIFNERLNVQSTQFACKPDKEITSVGRISLFYKYQFEIYIHVNMAYIYIHMYNTYTIPCVLLYIHMHI